MSEVKVGRLTVVVPSKLDLLSSEKVGGIRGVAVKCIDITKNTSGESGRPVRY